MKFRIFGSILIIAILAALVGLGSCSSNVPNDEFSEEVSSQ